MSKISNLDSILRETEEHAHALISCINETRKLYSSAKETVPKEEIKPMPEPKPLTLESVRAICAEKSRAGFTAEVKAIITKHGADKLSAIKPEDYAAVLAEVEVLGNAE